MKIRYLNGAFELTYAPEDELIFARSQHWSHHYSTSKPNTVVCFRNNKTIAYFRKYWNWYNTNVENFHTVHKYIQPFYPTYKPIKYVRKDLDGIELLDHQVTAVDLMLTYSKFCLFYGTGTGKTYMALTYLNTVKDYYRLNVLFVSKAKILKQLEKAIKEKLPDIEVIKKGDTPSGTSNHVITLSSYSSLASLKTNNITDMILDESHMAKKFTSVINKNLSRLAKLATNIYLFTGTPMDSSNHEKFAQFKLLYPELVPSKTAFMTRYYILDDYGKPHKYAAPLHQDELEEVISKISFGGDTEELLDLPPMHEYQIPCKFQDKTIYNEFYKNSIYKFPNNVKAVAKFPGSRKIKARQLCCGFINASKFVLNEDNAEVEVQVTLDLENPKEGPFCTLISSLQNGLIFTQFDKDIENVSRYLDRMSRTYGIVNGSQTPKLNDTSIERFKQGNLEFLVIQIKSGNAGLDLYMTNNVIFYSLPDGNFIEYYQAKYRIRRIGQTKDCNYYYLITKGTVERGLLADLGVKNIKHTNQFTKY